MSVSNRASGNSPVITGFFDNRETVDEAIARLRTAGIPRDRIEVVVTPESAEREYAGKARMSRRGTLRYAGIGGLIGLIGGGLVSIVSLAWPGRSEVAETAIVQLVGPNVATIVGAIVGGLVGLRIPHPPDPLHARVEEAPSGILLLVEVGRREDERELMRLLAEAGGEELRLELQPD